jgi:uncharacterized membrane protein
MRLIRHLFASAKRHFPPARLDAIQHAIAASEHRHHGEIVFAVEGSLPFTHVVRGRSARDRAEEVFARLRVWNTERNTGVLIYLLLADHDIEIVADRGINARVTQDDWERICRDMEQGLRRGEYEKAVVTGIEQASQLLASHYPPRPGDRNELPDRPVRL